MTAHALRPALTSASGLLLALSLPLVALAQGPATPQPAVASAAAKAKAVTTVPGMPPVPDPTNLYSEQAAGKVLPSVANDLPRVYVPHVKSNDVWVIDPATFADGLSPLAAPDKTHSEPHLTPEEKTWLREKTEAL